MRRGKTRRESRRVVFLLHFQSAYFLCEHGVKEDRERPKNVHLQHATMNFETTLDCCGYFSRQEPSNRNAQ